MIKISTSTNHIHVYMKKSRRVVGASKMQRQWSLSTAPYLPSTVHTTPTFPSWQLHLAGQHEAVLPLSLTSFHLPNYDLFSPPSYLSIKNSLGHVKLYYFN